MDFSRAFTESYGAYSSALTFMVAPCQLPLALVGLQVRLAVSGHPAKPFLRDVAERTSPRTPGPWIGLAIFSEGIYPGTRYFVRWRTYA
jgi:hypothetical protein